jgi:hypothetical protein
MATDDRLNPRELNDIERLAKEGIHGGLLEQAWCRASAHAGAGGASAAA